MNLLTKTWAQSCWKIGHIYCTYGYASVMIESKSGKMSVLDTFCVWGGGWGVEGGWMPLPTRPQQYCDPASLVLTVQVFRKSCLVVQITVLVVVVRLSTLMTYLWSTIHLLCRSVLHSGETDSDFKIVELPRYWGWLRPRSLPVI